ncbi:hypothetical protein MCHI_000931 [Candidatus Magnetoovum chiemensis]|nr:hypothetical protein MCHI_000931 [Candidatus Magnetoovum chiemensis]
MCKALKNWDVLITIECDSGITKKKSFREALDSTAGAWRDLVDCDELLRNIYENRSISARPEVEL